MPFHLMESKCRLQFKVGLKDTIINESQSLIWCDKVRNVWYFYKHLIHCDSPTHTHIHMNERNVSVSGAFSTFINELYDDPKDKHSLQHSLSSIWFDWIRSQFHHIGKFSVFYFSLFVHVTSFERNVGFFHVRKWALHGQSECIPLMCGVLIKVVNT